ncbi:hypothetical protein NON00_08555 [Roseomonas sp. GC11]|uniref:hypothetical protein n=1 Tax=Roseomonas sp. GC11 TaxID=2950546 RepID=UPI00210E69CE|nr:hypothetical protein [Roseomonas sp. GC11]MCQ4159980.1 hypothetical protein [Roseomonas sp. GC11]
MAVPDGFGLASAWDCPVKFVLVVGLSRRWPECGVRCVMACLLLLPASRYVSAGLCVGAKTLKARRRESR